MSDSWSAQGDPGGNPVGLKAWAQRRPVLLFGILVAAGLATNNAPMPLVFGIEFLLGGAFAMLALQMLGLRLGVAAAAIISLTTWTSWGHPFAIVTLTCEVFVVGLLMRRQGMALVLADAIYWLCVGMPLVFCIQHQLLGFELTIVATMMMQRSLNGVCNALLGRLLFATLSLSSRAEIFPLREVVFNLLALFVLAPSLLLLGAQSRAEVGDADRIMRRAFALAQERVAANLQEQLSLHLRLLALVARDASAGLPSLRADELDQVIQEDGDFAWVGVLDGNGSLVRSSAPRDSGRPRDVLPALLASPALAEVRSTLRPLVSTLPAPPHQVPTVLMLAPTASGGAYTGCICALARTDTLRSILVLNARGGSLPGMRYSLLDGGRRILDTTRSDLHPGGTFVWGEVVSTPLGQGHAAWRTLGSRSFGGSDWTTNVVYAATDEVAGTSGWRIVLEQPLAPIQDRLRQRYTTQLGWVFAILLAALLLAEGVSRRISAALTALGVISSGLPARVATEEEIVWPRSRPLETSCLIANFQQMSCALLEKFREIRQLNAGLERLVDHRTQELRESQQVLQAIIDGTSDAVYVKDLQGRYRLFNEAASRFTGKTAEEVIGHDDTVLFPPHEAETVMKGDQAVMTSARLATYEEHVTTAGDRTSVFLSTKGPLFDSTGTVVGLFGVARDITERRRAEQQLRDSEEFIRSVLDAVEESFIVVDRDYRVLSANRACCQAAGRSPEDIVGLHCFEVTHASHTPCWEAGEECTVRRTFETGLPGSALHQHRAGDGTLRLVETRSFPLRDGEGHVTSVIEVVTDVTEQRLLDEERLKVQKLEAIGTLAGGIAHDFNNLLQGLFGYISLAKMTLPPSERAHGLLERAEKSLDEAVRLTTRLLTFSKGGNPIKKPLSLQTVIQETVTLSLRGSVVECTMDFGEGLLPVEADEAQIRQVIQNVVLNAIQAMPHGGRLEVGLHNVHLSGSESTILLPHGDYVALSFRDNGVGIAPEHLPKIFEPHFSTRPKGSNKGTGLGLTTSHSIVANHGGGIRVESEPDSGSTFVIYLPVSTAESAGPTGADPAPPVRRRRVLVMEDEEFVSDVLCSMLATYGIDAQVVRDGQAALEHYERARERGIPFDAVLLDLTIRGGMGGEEAMRRLREIDPQVRAIVTSGYSDSAVIARFEQHGFASVLIKPYRLEDLQASLATTLGHLPAPATASEPARPA